MKTLSVQTDMFARGKSGFTDLIERRTGNNKDRIFRVSDVAAIFDIGKKKVHEYIECGRLKAANANEGIAVPVDPDRPELGVRPMLPYWRITHEAIMDLARSMEVGI